MQVRTVDQSQRAQLPAAFLHEANAGIYEILWSFEGFRVLGSGQTGHMQEFTVYKSSFTSALQCVPRPKRELSQLRHCWVLL